MFTQNSSYLAKRGWGYNQAQALYAVVPDGAAYEQLSARMTQHPDVLSLSGSTNHVGKNSTTTVLHVPSHEYEVDQLAVDARYFETMGITLLEGRSFNDQEESDKHAVVVNEVLVRNMGWEKPVGELFTIDSTQFEVIGVVKNFHFSDFYTPLNPTIFSRAEKKDYHYLTLKARSGSIINTYKALQSNWAELCPEVPFDGGFQEDVWGNYFQEIENHGKVWKVFAAIALALASLGLYGLMTLNVAGRVREFSLRKVLGAGLKDIALNITNQYLILFAVALSVGAPISYLLIKWLFDASFTYHIPVNFSGAATAVVVLILVLLITVSTQIRRVLKANPIEGLKVE
jgi:ABC-type antimicrobial peptide transport system permease subunit